MGVLGCSSPSNRAGGSTEAESVDSADSGVSGPSASAALPAPFTDLVDTAERWRWITTGDDLIDVWVCHVPLDTEATIYRGMTLRLPLTPKNVTDMVRQSVPQYYETISHGQYRPVFRPGGEVQMGSEDGPNDCIAEATERAAADAQGLLLVADAEHGSSDPGGFGLVGSDCTVDFCAVAATGRALYVGASDFHPDWGDLKPMDLVEHELGHLLGWGHSSVDGSTYLSALDVMSNSAAPRDVDPDRRDASDTLALNRVFAGWLPEGDVWAAPTGGGTVVLARSTGPSGTRLAVLPVDGNVFVTVELLVAEGYNDHLPADGVAVHRVAVSDGRPDDVVALVGEPPYDELLQPGAKFDVEGWRIEVARVAGAGQALQWTVRITRE